jgi:hypothetical protein
MLTSFKGAYINSPLKPSKTQEIRTMRKALQDNEMLLCADPTKICEISPKTKIIKIFSPEERVGVCHTQSSAMLLGIEGKFFEHFTMTGNSNDMSNIDVSRYCYYVKTPQKDDFVMYLYINTKNKKFIGDDTIIAHTAIYADNGRAISKFGIIPALVEHDLDEVPANYINDTKYEPSHSARILFFRKKPNIKILQEVKNRLDQKNIKENLACRYTSIKNELFELVTHAAKPVPGHILQQIKNNSRAYRTIEPFDLYTALQAHPGLNIQETNEEGETLLTAAVRAGNQKAMHLLIETGADINAPNKRGMTPLMVAAINNYTSIIQELFMHGANLNATNNEGDTALMMLAARHKTEQLLIKYGANVTIHNKKNERYESIKNQS